jgi:hypothetical protein
MAIDSEDFYGVFWECFVGGASESEFYGMSYSGVLIGVFLGASD